MLAAASERRAGVLQRSLCAFRISLLRFLLIALCEIGMLFCAPPVCAGEIDAVNAAIVPGDDGYALSADFDIKLGAHIEDAVTRGVALFFTLEVNVTRARWYWLDEHVVELKRESRLSYNALTRDYRIASGGLGRNFSSLAEALAAIAHLRALPIAGKDDIRRGQTYQCDVRLSLDRNQLPKPLQVDAIANRDWRVDSLALRWIYKP